MTFIASITRIVAATLSVAGLLATAPALAQTARNAAWWMDASRILAGEAPNAGSPLAKLAHERAVDQHRKAFARSWAQFEASRLKPAMRFSQGEVTAQMQGAGPVFYPFSGPDALYALAMFPQASDFMLVGLEPVGDLPDLGALSDADLAESLVELRRSMRSIITFSFFQTNDMRAELGKNRFSGVTPILMLFIARHGFSVQGVEPFTLEPDASLRVTDAAALQDLPPQRVPGVRIRFVKPGETKVRTLSYLRADLSNGGLAGAAQALKWVANAAPRATYLKAASYLMHTAHFSKVREFILATTDMVVQDDSGIPLRFFTGEKWGSAFYGTYDGPIKLFANRYQEDLRTAYATAGNRLDVGIGYDHRVKTSNIQRFLRKSGPAQTALAR
jgi:hypothetical protein